jgi:hypothetical protein
MLLLRLLLPRWRAHWRLVHVARRMAAAAWGRPSKAVHLLQRLVRQAGRPRRGGGACRQWAAWL